MKKRPLSTLDDIKASKELKEKTLQKVMNRKRSHRNWLSISITSMVVCACALLFLRQSPSNDIPVAINPDNAYTYVTMDINPSLELVLNEEDKIINYTTYNDEAKEIMSPLDIKGKDVNVAIQTILQSPKFQEYLSKGYLQISVFSKDTDKSLTMEKSLDESLSTVLNSDQYSCSCASKNDKDAADSHHISFGKYKVINEIIALDNKYTLEDLQNSPMNELINLYETISGTSYSSGGMHNGQGHGNQKQDGTGKHHH